MKKLNHEQRVLFRALLAGLPAVITALAMLWFGDYSPKTQWTLTVLILGFWLGFAAAARRRVTFPLQTLSNLLAGLREGDFSIRARGGRGDDAMSELVREVNVLSQTLREQRLEALEATALVRKVMEEIDVAVFAFDAEQRLQLVNRAGERALGQPAERIRGLRAEELGLAECLGGESPRLAHLGLPGIAGRWEVRRTIFRERGKPHQLLVLSDLSRVLREEEREAWRRLIRVLGHELNNSLTPIRSVAESLSKLTGREFRPPDWQQDLREGLALIGTRAEALSRFLGGYARLARLPAPRFSLLEVGAMVRRVVDLETRLPVAITSGPEVTIHADPDQLEQLLINLIRNAVEAALETGGGVRLGWAKYNAHIELKVEDEGPGLSNTANLFVPFFTTKPGGSGIGLVLSRQIAEAHGGSLTLENRQPGPGCEARLLLPL